MVYTFTHPSTNLFVHGLTSLAKSNVMQMAKNYWLPPKRQFDSGAPAATLSKFLRKLFGRLLLLAKEKHFQNFFTKRLWRKRVYVP